MKQPKVLVFSGFGLNCEEETAYGFERAGGHADIVHINDIIDGRYRLNDYQILAFPGGFSYGDDTGSGNAYAQKVKNHLGDILEKYIQKDRLIIGICNGFQILANLGLLPGLRKRYGEREVALLHNTQARYLNRWVDIEVTTTKCPWLVGIHRLSMPIAHGEGKFFAHPEVMKQLQEKKLTAVKYVKGEICEYLDIPANPNGSLEDIAGITDISGRLFGLMPHPDRALFFTQLPHWPLLKEELLRQRKPIPIDGDGIKVFQNGIRYFQ